MKKLKFSLLVLIVSLSLANTSSAHHSFASVYDLDEKVEISGTVKSFDLVNPHIMVILEEENAIGEVVEWEIESKSVGRWISAGHSRDLLKAGDRVQISGWLARDKSPKMALSAVTIGDDKTVILDRIRQG